MVESLLEWLSVHADQAHYIIFGLLVLTGLSVPISEDAMLIVSGILASTVIPDHTWHLFCGVFLGCYASDCIAYGIGRFFADKLLRSRWLFFSLSEDRLARLQSFYKKYGVLTLLVGRCIPFGVRNGIFMAAGASKMTFSHFFITDGISCFFFSLAIFFASYSCAQNYDVVQQFLHTSGVVVLLSVIGCAAGFFVYRKWMKRSLKHS